MSIDVKLQGGFGKKNNAHVDHNGRVHVLDHGVPAYGYVTESRIYRDFFKNSVGSSSMLVDGSSIDQDFFISADQENDRYVSSVSFVIADDGAKLNKFGAIDALTNGVEMFYEDESGVVVIQESMKTNWDFIRLSGGNPPFGNGGDAFKAKDVEGKVDSYIPIIEFKRVFGFTFGIRLKAASSQRLVIRIKDDVSDIDSFNAIAYGFDRLKD